MICEQVELKTTDEIDINDRSKWLPEPRVTIFHDTILSKKNIQISEGDEDTNLLLESQDEAISENKNLVAEFLQLHQRMGHIPFEKLRIMAQQNIIPKKFIKCQAPICAACTYAKLSKKVWQGKPKKNHKQILE